MDSSITKVIINTVYDLDLILGIQNYDTSLVVILKKSVWNLCYIKESIISHIKLFRNIISVIIDGEFNIYDIDFILNFDTYKFTSEAEYIGRKIETGKLEKIKNIMGVDPTDIDEKSRINFQDQNYISKYIEDLTLGRSKDQIKLIKEYFNKYKVSILEENFFDVGHEESKYFCRLALLKAQGEQSHA